MRCRVNSDVAFCSRIPYGLGMAKNTPLGIRLEDEERDALERAALADDRSMSALGRKILVEWLRKNGWLKGTKR
jgi:hypothetical protein